MPIKRKPGDPSGSKSGSKLSAARRFARGLSEKSLEAQRDSLRKRPTSIKGSRRRQSADDAQREISKSLGTWQSKQDIERAKKGMASRAGKAAGKAADKIWDLSEVIKRGAKKGK